METKHTPGPWIAERIMGNYVIHSESGVFKNIALVPAGPTDARLIAAAPELLAALQKYVEHFGDPLRCATEAIAKAVGMTANAALSGPATPQEPSDRA